MKIKDFLYKIWMTALKKGQTVFVRIKQFWIKWFSESIIGWGFVLLIFCFTIAVIFADVETGDKWVEFWGLIFDIFVIVILLGFVQLWQEKRATIARQHETIEDYKRWDNPEAVFRIAGAIRRLNRLGVTKVNLSGANLSDINLNQLGVESLKDSILGGGDGLEVHAISKFCRCDFFGVNCQGVRFSRNYLNMIGQAEFIDCDFYSNSMLGSDLFDGAIFEGAKLIWTKPPVENIYQFEGEYEDGSPILIQDVFTGFIDTDISNVNFRRCTFQNADFRNCYGVEKADFHHAKGLETCKFDTEELKEAVIKKATKRVIKKKNIS